MRLIDADMVDRIINAEIEKTLSFAEHESLINCKFAMLDLPTAYDADKVIEQLKTEGCIIDNEAGNRAVETIQKGGIE